MKHYQIVIKGVISKKNDLFETISMHEYTEILKEIAKCNFIELITTKIY